MYWFHLFSYWIYICFILYYFNFISFNPIIPFMFTILRDILFLFFTNKSNFEINHITLFKIFMIISVHYIPLYYLYNKYKKNKNKDKFVNIIKSALFYIVLFIIYLIYIYNNNLNVLYLFNNIEKPYIYFKNYITSRFTSYTNFIIWFILILYMNYKILNKKY